MSKPIGFFKTEEEFQKCAKWWQHKLFLDDWFIKFSTVDKTLEYDNSDCDSPDCEGAQLSGLCSYNYVNKEASIIVYNVKETGGAEDVIKDIAELSLVHELLHLKTEYVTESGIMGFENVLYNNMVHQSMECMAKTLIMTKYNIDYNYFLRSDNS